MAPGTDLSFLASEIATTPKSTLPQKSSKIALTALSKGDIIFDPSIITQDFDQLRFEAAALTQLDVSEPVEGKEHRKAQGPAASSLSTHLISSPYNQPGHYLDLTDLNTPNLIFAKALTGLKPTRPDYATAPYTETLNFPSVLELMRKLAADESFEWKKQSFYIVVFRSKLKASVDSELVYKLDYESHREACESGGLLKYWFGKPDIERRNLATCFWRSREDAYKGGTGPWHKKARAAGRELYEEIKFSTHRFTVLDGATEFSFEDWEE